MCGIFGLVGKNLSINIDDCLDSIKHRGPDDSGQYRDKNIILGFRRLSIIDLSPHGHQPMTNEDKSVWIIFNGEIYNYQELKKDLVEEHRFVSDSDTEVLIHGYEQWGIDGLLKKINGMFAFCLYDKKKQITYLIRDRIGKKPLYYYRKNNYIAFSSETKAFFHLKGFKFDINQEMFDLWMGFPYLPDNNQTLINNVNKIPPASYARIDRDNKVTINKYWQLPTIEISLDFSSAVNQLDKLLVDSVKKRLIADVPVGILLSGGIDSSLITAIASHHSSSQIRTITISFKNTVIDDYKSANFVAHHCKTNHTNLFLDVKNIYQTFKDDIRIYDDLSTSDSGLFSEYLLAKEIRKLGVKVALVGEGADEIFAGYTWFQLSQYPFSLFPNKIKSYLYYYAIMRTLPGKRFFKYGNFLSDKLNEHHRSFLKKIQQYEIQYSLPNHYCMKVDKGTSDASIEARSPFMDYRIIELASKLPDNYLLNSKFYQPKAVNEKHILRKVAEKYLPNEISYKKKKGGMMPVYDLLNIGLRQDNQLILNNHYILGFFGLEYIKKLLNSSPSLTFLKWQKEWILWKCLIFALWFDYYSNY